LKKQSDADNSGGAAFGEMSDEEKAAYVKNNEDSRNAFVKSQEEAQKLSDDMHREMGTSPISPDESKKIFDQQEKEILGGGEKPTDVTVGVDFVHGSNPGIATPNWDTVYTQETPPSPAAEEAKLKSQVSQPVDDTSRSFGKMEIDSRVLIQSTLERHTDGKSTPIPDGIDTPTGPGGSGVPTNPGDPDPVDVDSPVKE